MVNPAEKLVAGLKGRAAVAAKFEVSIEAVRLWLKHGIPIERALEVEEATRRTPFAISAIDVLQYAKAQRAVA